MPRDDKYLIFGDGFMASEILRGFPKGRVTFAKGLDIADPMGLRALLHAGPWTVVINAAGKTGRPNVDGCERMPLETVRSNALGPLVLAEACRDAGVYMAHLGSGCIFQGDNGGKGWSEDDTPNFSGSLYSMTKALSERALKGFENVLQLRLRMPITDHPSPRNLIDKLVSFKKVIDVPNSVTVAEDFVYVMLQLVERRACGIYNVTNPGSIRHPEILELYKKRVNPTHQYETFSVEECRKILVADRSNCLLSSDKLAREGIVMPEVHEAVDLALTKYASWQELDRIKASNTARG